VFLETVTPRLLIRLILGENPARIQGTDGGRFAEGDEWLDIPETLGTHSIQLLDGPSQYDPSQHDPETLLLFRFRRNPTIPSADVRLTIGILDRKSNDLNAWEYAEPEVLPFASNRSRRL
jgi:hypothetical protein